jgi:glycerol-3-phosphate dehydrogenase
VRRESGLWTATLVRADGSPVTVHARAVANATGPWVARFLDEASPVRARHHPRMIKGSHIVVPRIYEHEFAYIFQAPDGRVVFTMPFASGFTLIGTTERDYAGDLATPAIDEAEVDYLLEMANRHFARDLSRRDVVWTFAGLRPLLASSAEDPKSVTRDYVFELDAHGPPLLSVFGGKITTYRRLAEDVTDRLASLIGNHAGHWTAGASLPGGDMPGEDFDAFLASLDARYPQLPAVLRRRYARAYGTRIERVVAAPGDPAALREEILPGLYAAEVDYLRRVEWAETAEDILWRRSKIGLHVPAGSAVRLDAWLAAHPLQPPVPRAV